MGYKAPPTGKVVAVRLDVTTDEERERLSVKEMKTKDDLYGEEYGVNEIFNTCNTCGQSIDKCTGHSGHYRNVFPMFKYAFLTQLRDVLKVICVGCSHIRLAKHSEQYRHIASMPIKERLKALISTSESVHHCGLCKNKKTCDLCSLEKKQFDGCGAKSVRFVRKQSAPYKLKEQPVNFIFPVYELTRLEYRRWKSGWRDFPKMTPMDLYNIVCKIPEEEIGMLGLTVHPKHFMSCVQMIPSYIVRPSHTFSGQRSGKKRSNHFNDRNIEFAFDANAQLGYLLDLLKTCYNVPTDVPHPMDSRDKGGFALQEGDYEKSLRDCMNIAMYCVKNDDDKYKSSYNPELLFREFFEEKKDITPDMTIQETWRRRFDQLDPGCMDKIPQMDEKFNFEIDCSPMVRLYIKANMTSACIDYEKAKEKVSRHILNQEYRYNSSKSLTAVTTSSKGRKYGPFAQFLAACRTEQSCRIVCGASLFIPIGHIGVPWVVCNTLTVPEFVNDRNAHILLDAIRRGPGKSHGAKRIRLRTGEVLNLENAGNLNLIDIAKVSIVERHLRKGDFMVDNRNPSLHGGSVTVKKIIPIQGFTMQYNHEELKIKAADLDGDEINGFAIQNLEVRAAASVLMSTEATGKRDGDLWIPIIGELICAANIMTSPGTTFTYWEANLIYCTAVDFEDPNFAYDVFSTEHLDRTYTSWDILLTLLPKNFTMRTKDLEIVNGKWIRGQLDANTLNGTKGIIQFLHNQTGSAKAVIKFIDQASLVFRTFMHLFGMSVGLFDMMLYDEHTLIPEESKEFDDTLAKLEDYVFRNFRDHHPDKNSYVEKHIMGLIGKLEAMSAKLVQIYFEKKDRDRFGNPLNWNFMKVSIVSKAKGSWDLLKRISHLVGQVYTNFKRLEICSSRYHPGVKDNILKRYGFIKESLSDGMCPNSLDAIAASTMIAILNKNRGTAVPGERLNIMINVMYGVRVDQWGRVVNANGEVIQRVYGGDGFDSANLFRARLRTLSMREEEVIRRYGVIANMPELFNCTSKGLRERFKKRTHPLKKLNHETRSSGRVIFVYECDPVFHWPTSLELCELLSLRFAVRKKRSKGQIDLIPDEIRVPFDIYNLMDVINSAFMNKEGGLLMKRFTMPPNSFLDWKNRMWNQWAQDCLVIATDYAFKLYVWEALSYVNMCRHYNRWGKDELEHLEHLMTMRLADCRAVPGTPVGIHAAQSAGEPYYQAQLKKTHTAGKEITKSSSKDRLLQIQDGTFDHNEMTIPLKKSVKTELDALLFGYSILETRLYTVVDSVVRGDTTLLFKLNVEKCLMRSMYPLQILRALVSKTHLTYTTLSCAKVDDEDWWIKVTLDWELNENIVNLIFQDKAFKNPKSNRMTQWRKDVVWRSLETNILYKTIVHGMPKVTEFEHQFRKIDTKDGKINRWVITTYGASNIVYVSQLPQVDTKRLTTSNCLEFNYILGKFATRRSLDEQYKLAINQKTTDPRHSKLMADIQMQGEQFASMTQGHMLDKISAFQAANWEKCMTVLNKSALVNREDKGTSIIASSLSGSHMNIGTHMDISLVTEDDELKQMTQRPLTRKFHKYVASPKVDGERVQLIFFENRLCMVNRNFDVYPLKVSQEMLELIPADFFTGTILDGDFCTTKDGKDCFVIFDCLMCCGNLTYFVPYDLRVHIARRVLHEISRHLQGKYQDRLIRINSNRFVQLFPVSQGMSHAIPETSAFRWTSENMIWMNELDFGLTVKPIFQLNKLSYLRECVMRSTKYPFEEDGIVFTNLASFPKSFLSNPLFALKWKPVHVTPKFDCIDGNTMDFELKLTGPMPVRSLKEDLRFALRSREPLDDRIDMFRQFDVPTHPSGKYLSLFTRTGLFVSHVSPSDNLVYPEPNGVVECGWSTNGNRWIMMRTRIKQANANFTVLNNMMNVLFQVSFDDLKEATQNS